MAAQKGNKFWQLRSKHGRDKLFADPALLWEAACEYFTWCDNHPWVKKDFISSGPMAGKIVDLETTRPYTIDGFLLYIDASTSWWGDWKKAPPEGFSEVITRIDRTIYRQKFEGAAVGAFNANIIARDLGLVDKTDLTSKGKKIASKERKIVVMDRKIKKDEDE